MLVAAPCRILAAVGLDLLFGQPASWPSAARIARWFSRRFEPGFRVLAGSGYVAGAVFSAAGLLALLALYGVIDLLCHSIHPAIAWIFEVLVMHQALDARALYRKVGAMMGAPAEGASAFGVEVSVSERAVADAAAGMEEAIVAPLLWCAVFGAAGALIQRASRALAEGADRGRPAGERFGEAARWLAQAFGGASLFTALAIAGTDWFRSWGRVREDSGGGGENGGRLPLIAMAYLLNIRLPTGEDVGTEIHPLGNAAVPEDIKRCRGILLRVLALTLLCALAAAFFKTLLQHALFAR